MTFEELIEKAKAQTQALRATLSELSQVKIEAPTHDVPEITRALASLHAMKNGFMLTEVVEPGMDDYIDGKIEGLDCAIEALEGRGATRTRGRKPGVKRPHATMMHVSSPTRTPTHTTKLLDGASPTPKAIVPSGSGLSAGEEAVLTAILQSKTGCTHAKIAILTGYKKTSRETYLSSLRRLELVTKDGDRFLATKEGQRALPSFVPFKKGEVLETLAAGERAIFFVIAHAGSSGATHAMLAAQTGYKKTSRETFVSRLKARELVETRSGRLHLTHEAFEEVRDHLPKKLSGEALRIKWRNELPEGEATLFDTLVRVYPNGLTKDKIGELAVYKKTSVDTYISRLIARELVARDGHVYRAAAELF